jgi:hypothetical protein
MQYPKTKDPGETDVTKTVTLTERDVSDAARLFRLLGDPLLLASGMSEFFPTPEETGTRADEEMLVSRARIVFNGRRLRERYFDSQLFGEPAWDILLLLYIAEQSSARLTATRLGELIQTPLTTVTRWLNHLEIAQLIERQAHPTDGRSVFI